MAESHLMDLQGAVAEVQAIIAAEATEAIKRKEEVE